MPASVDKVKLVVDFRSDAEVKTVIKRTKSILAADHTFFSVESQNNRLKGPELEERMARQFVQHALEREPKTLLTVTDAYWLYADFLKRRDLIPPKRELFKGLVAPIVKEEFNLGLRNDLKGFDQKQKAGWQGIKPVEIADFPA